MEGSIIGEAEIPHCIHTMFYGVIVVKPMLVHICSVNALWPLTTRLVVVILTYAITPAAVPET